jgi:hypothetical protein
MPGALPLGIDLRGMSGREALDRVKTVPAPRRAATAAGGRADRIRQPARFGHGVSASCRW